MLCCSSFCEKYYNCQRAMINQRNDSNDNTFIRSDTVENLYSYGSCSIQYQDGKVVTEEHYVCGPSGKYGMFIPKTKPKTQPETTEHIIKEEKENMDSLRVCVEINSYTKDIDIDFDKPVRVRSVTNHDELVEIEHDGHKFIVKQSELEKAVRCASHNTF